MDELPILLDWVKNLIGGDINISNIKNGYALTSLFHNKISKSPTTYVIPNNINPSPSSRLTVWYNLVVLLKQFYTKTLKLVLLVKYPDIITIALSPESDLANQEILWMINLLLVAAVKSDNEHIHHIMNLSSNTQHVIMNKIQAISKDNNNCLPIEECESFSVVFEENEQYYNAIFEREIQKLKNKQDNPSADDETNNILSKLPSPELYNLKSETRKLTNELEIHMDTISQLKEDLSQSAQKICKLQSKNDDQVKEMQQMRIIKDENEILQEQARENINLKREVDRLSIQIQNLLVFEEKSKKLMSENEQLITTYNHTELHLIDTETILKNLQADAIKNDNQLKAKIEELSLENNELVRKISMNSCDNEKPCSLDISKCASPINQLENEVFCADSNNGASRLTIADQLEIDTKNAEIARLNLEVKRLNRNLLRKSENETSNNEIMDKNGNKKYDDLLLQMNTKNKDLISLRQDNDTLIFEKSTLEQNCNTLERNAVNQKNKITRIENENLLLHSEVKQFRHIAEVTKTKQQMNLEELRNENKTISIENDKLKTEKNTLLRNERSLELINNEFTSKVEALETFKSTSNREIENLKKRLADSENDSIKLTEEMNLSVLSLRNMREQFVKKEDEMNNISNEKKHLQKLVDCTTEYRTKTDDEISKLTNELKDERKTIINLKNEIMTNNYKMKSIEDEHKKLNTKYNLTISKNEMGDIAKNKAENKIIEDLKKRLNEEDQQSCTLHAEIKSLKNKIQILENKSPKLATDKRFISNNKFNEKIEQHKANDYVDQISKLKLQVEQDSKELESNRTNMSNLLRDNQTFQQRAFSDAERIKRDDAKLEQAQLRNETLENMNSKLEEDSRDLMIQMKTVLEQNQDLLDQMLNNKDNFHAQQKELNDRIVEMKRMKEQLEDKLMDQYKRYDPKKKGRRFGSSLYKRAKGMMSKRSQSRERDSTSIGSIDDAETLNRELTRPSRYNHRFSRQKSTGSLMSQSNKSKSTLNLSQSEGESMGMKGLKARSSENLYNESISSSNSSKTNNWKNGTSSFLQSSIASEDDDDNEDGKMSLGEFLQTCNNSPKSRKKILKSTNDLSLNDEDDEEVMKCTQKLDASLGPRDSLTSATSLTLDGKHRPVSCSTVLQQAAHHPLHSNTLSSSHQHRQQHDLPLVPHPHSAHPHSTHHPQHPSIQRRVSHSPFDPQSRHGLSNTSRSSSSSLQHPKHSTPLSQQRSLTSNYYISPGAGSKTSAGPPSTPPPPPPATQPSTPHGDNIGNNIGGYSITRRSQSALNPASGTGPMPGAGQCAWQEAANDQRRLSMDAMAGNHSQPHAQFPSNGNQGNNGNHGNAKSSSAASLQVRSAKGYTPPTPPLKHRSSVQGHSRAPTQLVRPSSQVAYDTRHGPVILNSSPMASSLLTRQQHSSTPPHHHQHPQQHHHTNYQQQQQQQQQQQPHGKPLTSSHQL